MFGGTEKCTGGALETDMKKPILTAVAALALVQAVVGVLVQG